jgi:hypothetical protein
MEPGGWPLSPAARALRRQPADVVRRLAIASGAVAVLPKHGVSVPDRFEITAEVARSAICSPPPAKVAIAAVDLQPIAGEIASFEGPSVRQEFVGFV